MRTSYIRSTYVPPEWHPNTPLPPPSPPRVIPLIRVCVRVRPLDFDGDDMISSADLRDVIDCLTGEQKLSEEDMEQLIDNVSRLSVDHV